MYLINIDFNMLNNIPASSIRTYIKNIIQPQLRCLYYGKAGMVL